MTIAVLTANLGNFDSVTENVQQSVPHVFHRFTDQNFPPIKGLTPRLQYRIPKMFGWEMMPGHDIYIWLDGSFSMQHPDSIKWFISQLGNADIAVFRHPWRKTAKEEVDHIEEYLKKGNKYITSRYENGLHKEQYDFMMKDPGFVDEHLFTSTAFVYRNRADVVAALAHWWMQSSRFFTCDQIVFPYILLKSGLTIKVIEENQYRIPYLSLTSHHK